MEVADVAIVAPVQNPTDDPAGSPRMSTSHLPPTASAADAAGARPTTVMEAAATSATAAMDLRMDLSSSRGSTNPSPAKIHERPRKGKVFPHPFFGHRPVTAPPELREIQESA